MKWIGLTGGIATGKSTVSAILKDRGYPVVDADDLAREVIQPGTIGLSQVIQAFGPEVLGPDGQLDRQKMAKLVFSDRQKLLKLESIIHPRIQDRVKQLKAQFQGSGAKVAFYDVPLLFEKNMKAQFELVVLVYASADEQRRRMKKRNQYSDLEVETRLASQLSIDDKVKLADFVVYNTGSIDDLQTQVNQLLKSIV